MNKSAFHVENFFYSSKNPMFIIDKKFSLKSFNPAFSELVGYPQSDFSNLNFIDLLHENDKEKIHLLISDSFKKKSDPNFDFRLINSTGNYLWLSCISSFIYDDHIYFTAIEKDKNHKSEITDANHVLNEIINRLPHPIFLKDNAGKYVLVNQSQSDLFSLSSIDLLGKDDSYFITDPEEYQEVLESDYKVINKKEMVNLSEQIVTTPKGERKILHTTKVPLISPVDGQVLILGISIDLTALKNYEEALNESEEKYKSLVELSPDAIIILENGRISFINNSGLSLFKASSVDDLLGKKFYGFIHKDYHSIIIERNKKLRNGEKVTPIEEKFIQLDGNIIDVEVSSIPFYYENKFAIQIIARNITDRVKARNSLFKRKQEFETLAENSNDIIARFNNRYEHLYINKTISNYANKEPGYFINKNIIEAEYPKHFSENVKRVLDYVFITGKTKSIYFTLPGKNGLENCFATIVPERNKEKKIKSVLCTVRNINELKLKENELISINKELNTFIYKASHDLKGPLATILGLSNLSITGFNKSGEEDLFKLINKTALRLNDTLKRLLEIVKIKEYPLSIESIDAASQIQNIVKEFENSNMDKGVKFSLRCIQSTIIKSDSAILSSIIKNLIENSIQYKKDSLLNIEINIEDYKDGIQISVTDNGEGIEDRIKDKIFDMFFRGNVNSKGSGLGLYLVRNAIIRLKGTVSFESEFGKGTKFILYVPSFNNV